jgi:hypothetical protein
MGNARATATETRSWSQRLGCYLRHARVNPTQKRRRSGFNSQYRDCGSPVDSAAFNCTARSVNDHTKEWRAGLAAEGIDHSPCQASSKLQRDPWAPLLADNHRFRDRVLTTRGGSASAAGERSSRHQPWPQLPTPRTAEAARQPWQPSSCPPNSCSLVWWRGRRSPFPARATGRWPPAPLGAYPPVRRRLVPGGGQRGHLGCPPRSRGQPVGRHPLATAGGEPADGRRT